MASLGVPQAYGDKGVGEIPGGATLEFDVEVRLLRLRAQNPSLDVHR